MSFHYQAPLNPTGFGVCGRGLFRGLEGLGLAPQLTPLYGVDLDQEAGDDPSLVQAAAARRVDPRADVLKVWHHHCDLTDWAGRGRRHLYTFFEVDRLPSGQVEDLNRQTDEVWAASRWGCEVLRASGYEHELRVLPGGVDRGVFHAAVRPAAVEGLRPETFVFVTAGKWSLNKGHDILLQAFHSAFRPSDDVALVCQCFNSVRGGDFDGPTQSGRWARWFMRSDLGRAGKIFVGERPLPSQVDLAALFARADCGVFSFRAEGFCLELFEMAAMGKPVIATAATAPAEYLNEIGAVGVAADGTEAAYDPPFFHGEAEWARLGPTYVRRLADAMRAAFEAGPTKNVRGQSGPWDWGRVASTAAGYMGVCHHLPSAPTSPTDSPVRTAFSPSSPPPA